MVLAMMPLLVLEPVAVTADRSLWRRRGRAVAGFLAGYLGLWLLAGVPVVIAVSALHIEHGQPGLVTVLALLVAVAWQLGPLKQTALGGCHRTIPLAPGGWRADRDCLRYGWMIGRSCLLSCWALMLANVLDRHSLLAMVGATAIAFAERYLVPVGDQGRWRPLLAIALLYALAVPVLL
jgi:predicted metal-binding membrane protein